MLKLTFQPVTKKNWQDFEKLFGPKGACAGCWCMFWRQTRSEFDKLKGDGNKRAMRKIVEAGEVPGILAYHHGQPIGWCAVAPRERFSALERTRVAKRIDDQAVWSAPCFFVHKNYRNQGVTVQLLRAAIELVKKSGGKILEGYPVEPKKEMPPVFVFYGTASAFRQAGFVECTRRSETRPFMRFVIE